MLSQAICLLDPPYSICSAFFQMTNRWTSQLLVFEVRVTTHAFVKHLDHFVSLIVRDTLVLDR